MSVFELSVTLEISFTYVFNTIKKPQHVTQIGVQTVRYLSINLIIGNDIAMIMQS